MSRRTLGIVLLALASLFPIIGVGVAASPASADPLPGPHTTLTVTPSSTSGPAPLTVIYTYKETNDGSHSFAWITVTDDTCAPVTFVNGDTNGNTLLDPGETWTYTCTRTFTAPGSYPNTVRATGLNTVIGGQHVEQVETTVVVFEPPVECDLQVVKAMSPAPLVTGEPASVTITMTNIGLNYCSQPGTNGLTVVTDIKPPGLTFSASAVADKPGWNCVLLNGSTGCVTFQPLPPGYTVVFTFNAVVTATAGTVTNCAGLSNPFDTVVEDNTSCASADVFPGTCDLQVVKTMEPLTLVEGQPATATITVTNVGTAPCIGHSEIADDLDGASYRATGAGPSPAGWTCFVVPPSGSSFGGALRCFTPGPIGPSVSATFSLNMEVVAGPSGVNRVNCAGVDHADDPLVSDPALRGNNSSCVTPEVVPPPKCDLQITKDMVPTPLVSGQPATVTFTVTNVGDAPCAPASIRPGDPYAPKGTLLYDNKPAGFTFTSIAKADQPGWICWGLDYGVPDVGCLDQTTLLPGYSATITVNGSVTAPAGTSVSNCVYLTNGNDVDGGNNGACVTKDVVASAPATTCDLELVKSMAPDPLVRGGRATINLTLTNIGTGPCSVPAGLAGPQVVDNQPAGLVFTSFATPPTGWNCRLNTVNLYCEGPLTPLPAGYTATFTLNAVVTAAPGDTVRNFAVAGTNDHDVDGNNNASIVVIAVVAPTPRTPRVPVTTAAGPAPAPQEAPARAEAPKATVDTDSPATAASPDQPVTTAADSIRAEARASREEARPEIEARRR